MRTPQQPLLALLLILTSSFQSFAQPNTNKLYITPEVSIGYIFDVAFTWGVDVNCTTFELDLSDQVSTTTGVGITFNRFYYRRTRFTSYSFNVVNFTNYSQIKIGANWMRTKWGEGFRNKSSSNAPGFNMELGGTFGKYAPWLTMRTFGESNKCLYLPLRKQYIASAKYLYSFPIVLKTEVENSSTP